MFQIKFRIVDNLEELKLIETACFDYEYEHVYGFFQICFGEQKEGSCYHENPLGEDETGDEVLDYWFVKLLDVISLLDKRTSYVAFKEIETERKWLEFKRLGESIFINAAIAADNGFTQLLILKQNDGFSYITPLNYTLTWSELRRGIFDATKRFLKELNDLNPKLMNTKMALEVRKKLANVEELC